MPPALMTNAVRRRTARAASQAPRIEKSEKSASRDAESFLCRRRPIRARRGGGARGALPQGPAQARGVVDVERLSYVEGEIGGRYGTDGEGAIQAQFRDQYATIRFPLGRRASLSRRQ